MCLGSRNAALIDAVMIRVSGTQGMVGSQSQTCSAETTTSATLNGCSHTRTFTIPSTRSSLMSTCSCSPTMRVTANMGMEMPSWFDIISFGFKSDEDEDGMLKTVRSLNELITAEVDAGIPADRIVLGGFSQGGAMSILTGLTSERKLGGIACLSGWVPLRHKFEAVRHVRYYPYEVSPFMFKRADGRRSRKKSLHLLGPRQE